MHAAPTPSWVGMLIQALIVACIVKDVVGKVKDVTPIALEKIIDSTDKLLLVEWYSPDCPFCKNLAPILEDVSSNTKDFAYILRIDLRASYEMNRKYSVRSAPTMLLFSGGKQILQARDQLQGLRDVDALTQFLRQHAGEPVQPVSSSTQVEAAIQDAGYVVLGLFNSSQNKYYFTFKEVAQQQRAVGHFMASSKAADAQALAAYYGLPDQLPLIAVVQTGKHVLMFRGQHTNRTAVDAFVAQNAFAQVGQLNPLTYQRYADAPQPKMFTFYDQYNADESERVHKLLEKIAPEYPRVLFVLVESRSSEGGTKPEDRMHLRLGITDFRFPAVALVTSNSTLVHDQMAAVTEASLRELLSLWQRPLISHRQLCQVPSWRVSDAAYEHPWISEYDSYSKDMAEKIGFRDGQILDMGEEEAEALQQRTKRDVLLMYTARWCMPSLHMEAALVSLVDSGEIVDLLHDQLLIVRVDAISTRPNAQYRVEALPMLRYVSARFKHAPHFYTGADITPGALLHFIRTYNTLRFVEVPGEEPSEFAEERVAAQLASRTSQQRAVGRLLSGKIPEDTFDPEDLRMPSFAY